VDDVLSHSGYTESRGSKMDVDDLLKYVTMIPLGFI
jgi:hypothetical protein